MLNVFIWPIKTEIRTGMQVKQQNSNQLLWFSFLTLHGLFPCKKNDISEIFRYSTGLKWKLGCRGTKRGNVHCDWFILLLLLPTPAIWFSLDHKRWSHKQSLKKMEMFWFFWLSLCYASDSAYYSNFWFSQGHKCSYSSALTTPTLTWLLVKINHNAKKNIVILWNLSTLIKAIICSWIFR